jgi:hypothetical protein
MKVSLHFYCDMLIWLKKAENNSTKERGRIMSPVSIIRWVALAIAVVAAFVAIPYGGLALVVLGAALGFMGVSSDDRVMYLVGAVALAQVAGALGAIPAVGGYITDIMTNFSTVWNAGAAAVILVMIKERVMS